MHAVNATRSHVDFVLLLHPAMFIPQAATGRQTKIRSDVVLTLIFEIIRLGAPEILFI